MSWNATPDQAELEAIVNALREQLGAAQRERDEALRPRLLETAARAARDEALAEQRARFDRIYGCFWKCVTPGCGRFCGLGDMMRVSCPEHPQYPPTLVGYTTRPRTP